MRGPHEAIRPFPLPFVPVGWSPPEAVTCREEQGRTVYPDIMYAHIEGFRPLRMDLYVPHSDRRVPVVVFVHGGAWRGGSRKPPFDFVDFTAVWDDLNGAGIAVASVSYRLSGEATFPACLHDVRASIRWLHAFGGELGLDGTRIGAFGESAGAHLALLAAQRIPTELEGDTGVTGASPALAAVVAWYPATDLTLFPKTRPSGEAASERPEVELLGGQVEDLPELARAASPITWVGADSPPTLLVHGTADSLISFEHSEAMAAAYAAAGASAELRAVASADHCFLGIDIEPIREDTVRFLSTHLKTLL